MKKQQSPSSQSVVLPCIGVEVPSDTPKLGNCGVTACAIMAGKTFNETWDAFYKFTPKGDQWKGSSRPREQRKVLNHFGVRIEELTVPYAQMTVGAYAKRYAKAQEMYLVGTGSHAQILFRDRVFDQNTPRTGVHFADYWGRRKYVSWIWRRLNEHEADIVTSVSSEDLERAFGLIERATGKPLGQKNRDNWLELSKSLPARPQKAKNLYAKIHRINGKEGVKAMKIGLEILKKA